MNSYQIRFPELQLRHEDVLFEMGYEKKSPEPYVTDALDELWPLLQFGVIAECAFLIEEGVLLPDRIIIRDIELHTGTTIAMLLENSVRFAIFTGTAGGGFEELTKHIKGDGDTLKIYLMDIIGTCIAEKTGYLLEKYLENEVGEVHTNRFSPGYCGWHLTEQRNLFGLFGDNPCGITLSDVCLMTPIKSISGIIGIGENVSKEQYACSYCELTTCYKKRTDRKN